MRIKKKTRSRIMLLLFFGVFMFFIVINIINQSGLIGGDWTTINTTLINTTPYVIGIGLGFLLLIKAVSSMLSSILVGGLVGIFFSGLFYSLYIGNIWIDELISASFTITDLQTIVVIFWLFMGILIGLIKR